MSFDLLSFLFALTRGKGINPLEYQQTLKESSRRWGASSILRKDGIGIDLVFQEFSFNYPWMFDSLDDFVEALAERLGRKRDQVEQYGHEAVAELEENEESIILNLQRDRKLDALGKEVMEEKGLIVTEKGKRKVRLTEKAIRKVIELSVEEENG